MREQNHVEISCPVCGATESHQLFVTRDYTFQCSDQLFALRRCQRCSCGYLSPRPLERDMSLYYSKEYYWSWEGAFHELSWDGIVQKRQSQLDEKAKWLEDMTPGRLLDIGAQKGEFIWHMQKLGWQVEGVELDESVPNPANMPIRYGDFLNMDLDPNGYDCITFWAVLEHVYYPSEFIKRASELLRPGGRLIALVTNLNSIQSRYFRADDYPRHLTIFTPKSARKLCSKHSLKITRIHTGQEIFGGALNGGLVYVSKRLCGYSEDEAFHEWKQPLDPELFWVKWKGRPSIVIRNISRIDRAITLPLEKLLDRLGFGFNMTICAEKIQDDN